MLVKWGVRNFKCFRAETELELAPLTILTGANGSGKSALIQSMLLVAQTLGGPDGAGPLALNGPFAELAGFGEAVPRGGDPSPVTVRFTVRRLPGQFGGQDGVGRRPDAVLEADCEASFEAEQSGSGLGPTQGDPAQGGPLKTGPAHARLVSSRLSCRLGGDGAADSTAGVLVDPEALASPPAGAGGPGGRDPLFACSLELGGGSGSSGEADCPQVGRAGCGLRSFLPVDVSWGLGGGGGDGPSSRPPAAGMLGEAADHLGSFFASSFDYVGPQRLPPELRQAAPLPDPGLASGQTPGPASFPDARERVGRLGENVLSLLRSHGRREIRYIPAENFMGWEIDRRTVVRPFEEAIADWIRYIGLDGSGQCRSNGAPRRGRLPLSSVGRLIGSAGAAQVLPAMAMCLLARPGSLLVMENPDSHLHPAAQARLADFLIGAALSGRRCLVETHSEYIFNRLRYQIANSPPDQELLDLFRAYNVEGSSAGARLKEVEVDEFGTILDRPSGYFELSHELVHDILMASIGKENEMMRRKIKKYGVLH